MRLWAISADSRGEPVPDESGRWLLDGDEVETGLDVFVDAPKPGKHRAALIVETREGRVEATATFTTVELPEERDED